MEKDMTVGNPTKMILNFTIPIFIGNIFHQFYSMADTVIVGKFVGNEALAAVGACGTLMFLIIGISMRFIMSLKSDGTLNYETLKGMTGSVYISIPGNLQRGGQVTIAHPSQLLYLPAVQEGEHPLPSGTPVEVVAVTAGIVTVKPLH